jgi:hypothetical protein
LSKLVRLLSKTLRRSKFNLMNTLANMIVFCGSRADFGVGWQAESTLVTAIENSRGNFMLAPYKELRKAINALRSLALN